MLKGKRILIVVGKDYEDLELWYPRLRLQDAGVVSVVAGQLSRHTYKGKHGYPCDSEALIAEVKSGDFDGVLIPGGWMPDLLRRDENVLRLVREFDAAGKLVASICHGPWINISAGIVKGVRMTSSPGIKDDLINAGAQWVDATVVVDRHHVSSRRPADLPQFAAAMIERLSKSK